MQRKIVVSGIDGDAAGYARLFVDVYASNGSLIDCYRRESQAHDLAHLWKRYGRRAVRYFRKMYNVQTVELPSTLKLRDTTQRLSAEKTS